MVVEAMGTTITSIFHLFQAYNPVIVLCILTFSLGMLFLAFSFLRTLWSAHVTIRLGPIALVVIAVIVAWFQLSDGAREMLGELIKMTPRELYSIMNGNSTS